MPLPISFITFLAVLIHSTSAFLVTTRGHPCVRRNNQILCPFEGSPLANLHQATTWNESLKVGPNLYHRKAVVPTIVLPVTNMSEVPKVAKSMTYEMYYTKQYDEQHGLHAFDMSDDEEHNFMHDPTVQEKVIDHRGEKRTIPKDRITTFIEENRALTRRMFGEPDSQVHYSSFHYGSSASTRRSKRSIRPQLDNKVDSCKSSTEIVTPYWASNSAGKIRAIVNTQHLQQAIQQRVCQAVQTKRCHGDCTCEQEYMWHRLLAYDPDEECKGIFMEWFLFPSGCACRCPKF